MNMETKIWKMIEGEITELKLNNTIFTIKETKTDTTFTLSTGKTISPSTPMKKLCKHNVKKSYLEKWIQNGSFEVFTLDMFYKAYPMQKQNKNLDIIISKLIREKKIYQTDKDKFKVNRRDKRC